MGGGQSTRQDPEPPGPSWNPPAGYRPEVTLHQLVEERAAIGPDTVALVQGTATVSFGELDRRANRLAHHLRAGGVGPEVLVGLCMRRSVDAVVGLLAILKAGGAYVPLDPDYPQERLRFTLDDAAPRLVLAHAGTAERLGATAQPVIHVDEDRDAIAAEPCTRPEPLAGADALACVIYTSGSTGTPKGVMATHRAFVSRLGWIRRLLPFGPDDVACHKTSLSFVDSVAELFRPLSEGVATVVVPPDVVPDPRRLVELLEDAGVTRIVVVPSLLRALSQEVDLATRLPLLTTWIVSGETLPAQLARRFVDDRPGSRLFNFYGSSEVAADATWYEVLAVSPDPVPIGVPVDGVAVHVLDADGSPVPAGAPGELYVGGTGLARGYLGRADLTAERFGPDPFSSDPDARLFRTGDLGRQLPDGTLEFTGRADHQVKVDGVRVECGEVEARLLAHPGIGQAVVVATEDASGYAGLVAYVVPEGAAPAAAELRRHLLAFLTPPMVPGAFVVLDGLPLTPSGKVDRLRLPPPGRAAQQQRPFVVPGAGLERLVADVWAEVLGVDGVGRDHDFFELGGRSLHAARAAALLGERLGIDLPLRVLFDAPTVAGLAAAVGGLTAAGAAPVPPLRATQARRGPLSTFQEQLWTLEGWGEPGRLNDTLRHRFPAPVDTGAVRAAVAYLVERHEALRTTFPVEAGRPEQVVGPLPSFEMATTDLGEAMPAEQEPALRALVARENAQPFDTTTGPMFRARLVLLGGAGAELVLTVDHLVGDGESLVMLEHELKAAYAAFAAGREPDLRPVPVGCVDYAIWQRGWLTPERLEAECNWWVERLGDVPMVVGLPYDRPPAGPEEMYSVLAPPHVFEVTVEPPVLAGLTALLRPTHSTMFVLCVAAVDALLAPYIGRDAAVVTTIVSARDRPDLERVLGYFAVPATLLTDLSGDPSFAELVGRARDAVLGLFEHKNVAALDIAGALGREGVAFYRAMHPVDVQFFPTASGGWVPGAAAMGIAPVHAGHRVEDVGEATKPLVFAFYDNGEQLWLRLRYRPEFFDQETVEELASRLLSILSLVVERPQTRLSELAGIEPAGRAW